MPDDSTDWVCVPCALMVPGREGRVTVHGDHNRDALTVWCPWCGDAMENPHVLDGGDDP